MANLKVLRKKIKNTDKTVLTRVVQSIDGHTIYKPEMFTEMGLDDTIVKAFTKTIKSDFKDPKSTIFTDGEPVKSLTGVYGLSLLEFIASTFGVDSWKGGRGSRAQHLTEQLIQSNFTSKE